MWTQTLTQGHTETHKDMGQGLREIHTGQAETDRSHISHTDTQPWTDSDLPELAFRARSSAPRLGPREAEPQQASGWVDTQQGPCPARPKQIRASQ